MEFIVNLYSPGVQGHLWYLYLYIAYLVVLPFLRAMVKNLFENNDKLPKKLKMLILSIDSCTFGIYLIHMWVRDLPFLDGIYACLKGAGITALGT